MIFAKHNTVENFKRAVSAKDKFMQKEIILDEIGRVIADHKGKVINALKAEGVSVRPNIENVKLANIAMENIVKNRRFRYNLGKLIEQYGFDGYKNFDSEFESQQKGASRNGINPKVPLNKIDVNTSINDTLDFIGQEVADKKTRNNNEQTDTEKALEERIRQSEAGNGGKGLTKKQKIVIGVGIFIVVAGIFIWWAHKKGYINFKGNNSELDNLTGTSGDSLKTEGAASAPVPPASPGGVPPAPSLTPEQSMHQQYLASQGAPVVPKPAVV